MSSSTSSSDIIRPIEADSVRRIVAGQAVTDLASAVKELVDNALDAGGKTINIRLFDQGLRIVEVSDDGTGVPSASRPFLATPHATSKIRSFQDIYNDSSNSSTTTSTTLGFRGEALFCLANLSSKLVIATRTKDDAFAQRLEFRRDGSLDDANSKETFARKIGTTVAVLGLLEAVSVRRADLMRRIPQQRAKLIKLMEGYAVFSIGVRINLMDMVGTDCRESTILATTATSTSLQETVSSVLGSHFLANLCPFEMDLSSTVVGGMSSSSSLSSSSVETAEPDEKRKAVTWKIHGLVSKAGVQKQQQQQQQRRTPRDRQLFSINGRPVELPKLARVVNDVWRTVGGPGSSSNKRRPSCVLQLTLPAQAYDVNLSPDKRQVLLTQQDEICKLLQEGLTKLWSSQTDGKFAANQLGGGNKSNNSNCTTTTTAVDYESASSDSDDDDDDETSPGRFNRRYAFCRDLSKARLQHEYDDGRRRITPKNNNGGAPAETRGDGLGATNGDRKNENSITHSAPEEMKRDAPFNHQVVDHQRTAEERKRLHIRVGEDLSSSSSQSSSAANMQKNAITCSPDYAALDSNNNNNNNNNMPMEQQASVSSEPEPSKLIQPPVDRPSPAEQRRWRVMQQTFNNASSSGLEEEVQMTEETTTTTTTTTMFDRFRADARPDHEEKDNKVQSGLERFGFQATRVVSGPATSSSKSSLSQEPLPAHTNQDSTLPSAKRLKKNDKTPPVSTMADSSDEEQQQQEQGLAPRRRVTEVQSGDGKPTEVGRNDSIASLSAKSNNDFSLLEKEEPPPPPTVVWGSFKGTKDVVLAARRERLAMRDRKQRLQEQQQESAKSRKKPGNGMRQGETVSGDGDPNTNEGKVISILKDDFRKMTVIGQFNLGFILARSQDNNLWILDQHACDEKYNFEKLCAETVIHEQRLIAPLPLELTPAEETCVLDHMDIFEKNGFRFAVDLDKPPRKRLALTALPHSGARDGRKAVQFGKEDVSALCAILGVDDSSSSYDHANGSGTGADGSGMYGNNAVRRYAGVGTPADTAEKVIARLPKAIAMFASRACRGSIMIGKALSKKEMDRIVKRLENVEHPWNCPHGRPTMRHVAPLQADLLADEKLASEHLAGPTVTVATQEEVDGLDN